MKKHMILMMTIALCGGLLAGRGAWADYDGDEKAEHHEITADGKVNGETLEQVKVSLAQGLGAAQAKGTPISGKFEIEDGKLQLSVYTNKKGKFSEVIVDLETGKVAKTEAITGGEDLADAKAQNKAMAKAKVSLQAAVDKALNENKGFQVISVTPSIKDGHPVADVSLGMEEEVKTVSEKLD